MNDPLARVCEFGRFRIDPMRRLLFRDGAEMQITARALDLLLVLIDHRSRVVTKHELMQRVWPDSIVQEANLTQNVFVLRKLLGESPREHRYILTVPGIGYRFVADVREPGRAAPLPVSVHAVRREIRSIAVMPFRTLDVDATDEHLGVGLADAVATRLSGLKQLAVRAVSGIPGDTDASIDPCVLGRTLGVDALIMGTVKRARARIRVTVQLIAVGSGQMLWAHQFDEEMTDLFAVEDSVSDQVKRALVLELTEAERSALTKRHTSNTDAYSTYLKGRYFWNKRTAEGFHRAIEFFEIAIAQDPTYALAYAGVADCLNFLSMYSAVSPDESYPRATRAATTALELDDELAEAHVALAYAKLNYHWSFEGAEREFRRALELHPNYATAHHLYADLLTSSGRFSQALEEVRRAQELDPFSLIINTDIGWALLHARQYEAAIRQLHETLDLDPTFWCAHWVLGQCYEQTGRPVEAIESFEVSRRFSRENPYVIGALGRAYAAVRRRADAYAILSELDELTSRRYVSPYLLATVHATLGDKEEAFACLERAYEERSHWLIYLEIAAVLDSLRSDARFGDLVRRVRRRGDSAAYETPRRVVS